MNTCFKLNDILEVQEKYICTKKKELIKTKLKESFSSILSTSKWFLMDVSNRF
uniref:Uncharacterized protein n=1 Tax=Arion vulgaris TaxID=1028688 RepID=A0A0B6Y714_9EUPU